MKKVMVKNRLLLTLISKVFKHNIFKPKPPHSQSFPVQQLPS